jgi:hypothetical protein
MDYEKEFACAINCRLKTKFPIPHSEMRDSSVFTFPCRNKTTNNLLLVIQSRLAGEDDNKVDLAIERSSTDPTKNPDLICGVQAGKCDYSTPL